MIISPSRGENKKWLKPPPSSSYKSQEPARLLKDLDSWFSIFQGRFHKEFGESKILTSNQYISWTSKKILCIYIYIYNVNVHMRTYLYIFWMRVWMQSYCTWFQSFQSLCKLWHQDILPNSNQDHSQTTIEFPRNKMPTTPAKQKNHNRVSHSFYQRFTHVSKNNHNRTTVKTHPMVSPFRRSVVTRLGKPPPSSKSNKSPPPPGRNRPADVIDGGFWNKNRMTSWANDDFVWGGILKGYNFTGRSMLTCLHWELLVEGVAMWLSFFFRHDFPVILVFFSQVPFTTAHR